MMRDMVLKSDKDKVTGYYLDKKSQKKRILKFLPLIILTAVVTLC